jgi:hypothetical protein
MKKKIPTFKIKRIAYPVAASEHCSAMEPTP